MKLNAHNVALGLSVAGVGFVLWKWGVSAPSIAAGWVMNTFNRGNKLSDSTAVNGVVQEVPEVLIDMASAVLGFTADLDTYSLARAGRSEGVDGMEYRMHAILNDLDHLQASYGTGVYSSITAFATHSKNARGDGHYSSQDLGKRFATTRDPYEGDYALAQKVRSDHQAGIDPTSGATKFVDKSGPFYIEGQEVTYNELVEHWGRDGLTPVSGLPGATDNFVIFVRA